MTTLSSRSIREEQNPWSKTNKKKTRGPWFYGTYLQPHFRNGVFSNVYLSAGQHLDINIPLLHFAASRGHLAMYEFFA